VLENSDVTKLILNSDSENAILSNVGGLLILDKLFVISIQKQQQL